MGNHDGLRIRIMYILEITKIWLKARPEITFLLFGKVYFMRRAMEHYNGLECEHFKFPYFYLHKSKIFKCIILVEYLLYQICF